MIFKFTRLWALVFALASCISLWAQGDRSILTGTVKDASGALVPNATVIATESTTGDNHRTVSSTTGTFTIPDLPAGTYRVRVEATGFKTEAQDNVVFGVGAPVNLDFVLEVGSVRETVEVTAQLATVDTDSARVASQVEEKMVNDLPVEVNGAVRSPLNLATIVADVSGSGSGLRVGGGGSGGYGFTLDNGAATTAGAATLADVAYNAPSVEAIQEFAVDSSGFKAETGHASGGTISFVSKSGTNNFHGSVYEFLRNQDMDARGFFALTKPVYKQNDFGVTAGGPVYIPKIYHGRNKTFIFGSYEGFRNRVGASPTPSSVPPPEFYDGNFQNWVNASGVQYAVYDPASTALANGVYTRTPFPNNQIPLSRIDPVAMAVDNFVAPLIVPNDATAPGTSGYVRNNYISEGSTESPQNKLSFKLDHVLTTKQHLSFYYGHTLENDKYGATGPPGLPAPLAGNPGFNLSEDYRFSHDYSITPTLINRFVASGTYFGQNHASYGTVAGSPESKGLTALLPASEGWAAKGICIPNYPDCNLDFPQISTGDFTSWGVAAPNGSDNVVVEFKDDLTKVHGKHTFKVGFAYDTIHYDGFGEQNFAGNASFSTQSTSVPLSTNQNTGGGSGFAAFLLGQVSGYSLDTPRYLATFFRTNDAYAQDDWKVSSKLTLNLGVRFEMSRPPISANNEMSDLSLTAPNPAAGNIPGALVFAGFGTGETGTRTLVSGWDGFSPRFGFAYALDKKTTIRGSAGTSYGPITDAGSSSHYLGYVNRLTLSSTSQGLTPEFVLSQGAPAPPTLPDLNPSIGNGSNPPWFNGNTATTPSNEYNFSFNVQRQVVGGLTVEAGFVGTEADHLPSTNLTYNALDPLTLPACASPFTPAGRTVLASLVGSATANACGITAPFPGFNALWGASATVEQALRPFPQYSTIDTIDGGGDRVGHSTYDALEVKVTKRYGAGLSLQASYVHSRYFDDINTPEDPEDRHLEKSIDASDQPNVAKVNYSYELPVGHGKQYLNGSGVLQSIVGNWRVGAIQTYASGLPIGLTTTNSLPIFAGSNRPTITTYQGWYGTYSGAFNPAADLFIQPASFFGTQPTNPYEYGNMTRYNNDFREPAQLSESVSLARTVRFKEKARIELRGESFNVLNRTQFGPLSGATSLQNANYGLWRNQSNSPRQMQVSMKLVW